MSSVAADGVPVSVIRDSSGCVAQRVLAHIVNIGCDIAQQGIATPEDIAGAIVGLITGGDFVTGQTLIVDGGLSLS